MTFQIVLEPELAASYKARGLWTGETFFEVLERKARAHPDREVFADAKGRITYGALKDKVERCAEVLRRIGIGKGDVVTVQLPNRIDFPIVFFALELIGLHPEVLGQPRLCLPPRVQGLRLCRHGPGAAQFGAGP
jgi:non-ribosomal peptide synthetase component E (peptide arylation enzyme)